MCPGFAASRETQMWRCATSCRSSFRPWSVWTQTASTSEMCPGASSASCTWGLRNELKEQFTYMQQREFRFTGFRYVDDRKYSGRMAAPGV